MGSGPHHNYISRASGRKCRASNTSFLQDSCLPILYRLEGILLKAHVSSMDVAEPTAGAKRNVETRCSRIAHGGILFLVLLTMPVLSAAACAIFEQRVSTLCLAPASCSANCRPDLMQAWPACALLGCPLLSWAVLGSLQPWALLPLGSPFACRRKSVPGMTCGIY